MVWDMEISQQWMHISFDEKDKERREEYDEGVMEVMDGSLANA